MSVFDIFRPVAPQPAPAPAITQPTTIPPDPATTFTTTQTTTNAEVSPLDAFKDIWETDSTAKSGESESLFGGLDATKINEAAKTVDFTKVVTPADFQAIAAGGEGAVEAFTRAMNSIAQTVYANSAIATTKIVEQAIQKTNERNKADLSTQFKKFQTSEGLAKDNKILSNPAIQPLVSALTEQLTRKHPNSSAAEIQAQVVEYFQGLASSVSPAKPDKKTEASNSDTDFSSWLNS